MTLLTISTPNLIQGVSQQPDSLRLPSQCEVMDNWYPSVIDGLQKRHPTEHVVKAINGNAGATKMHLINRDASEQYVVLLRNGDIKVFDTAGVSVPVKGPTGPYTPDFSYIAVSDPADLRAVTVADYTLVVNRTKVPALSGSLTSPNPSARKAFLFVRQTSYKIDYTVKLQRSGSVVESATTSTWDGTATTTVKEIHRITITAAGTAGGTWTVTITASNATYTVQLGDTPEIVAQKLGLAINALGNVSAISNGATITVIADLPGVDINPTVTPPAGGSATSVEVVQSTTNEEQTIKTNDVAQRLAKQINAFSGFTADVVGSVIRITSTTDLTLFDHNDSLGDRGMVRVWNSVDNFTDLPLVCEDGFRVKVQGDVTANEDDYYVQFVADATGQFANGKWIETSGFDLPYAFDTSTMPWQLVRKQDDGGGTVTGTPNAKYFEWGPVTWNQRIAGDETSAPPPSFIGKAIKDIFFFRNRLGFVADQNVILSEAGRYFNFWRTTVTTVVDSDTIDVSAAHVTVSLLHAAVPMDERLILFSERTQFVLTGTPLLTPKTVGITPILEYENLKTARPIATARGMFFAHKRGTFSGVYDLVPLDNIDKFDADDITAQVPKFVAGQVVEFASSTTEDILFALADSDRSVLYVFKHFWSNGEKLQSAWGRFLFGSGASVWGVDFIQNTAYFAIQRTEGLFIEKMTIAPGQVDANSTYVTYLDRRLTDASSGVSRVYSIITNRTTITLPYNLESGMTTQVVTRCTAPNNGGAVLTILATGANTVEVQGDHTADALWIGQQYVSTYTFSQVMLREDTSRGRSAVATGRLQVMWGTVVYDNTGYFQVEVTPLNRTTYEYPFGHLLGSANNLVGQVALESGRFRFPVLCKNDEVTILVTNESPLPCNLQSAEFEAQYHVKARGRS